MSIQLSDLEYDELLDYLELEDTDKLLELFQKYNLNVFDLLFDAPRYNDSGDELLTYLDYAIAHNLTGVIDFCIEQKYLQPDDKFLARCISLHCIQTYQYYIDNECIPGVECLREATKLCYSELIDNILSINCEVAIVLLEELDDEIIEYLFSFDIDEETVETVRVLFNHNIAPEKFSKYLKYLHNPDGNYFNIAEDDQDLVIELIDILESNGVE
jgi:hypothetical protein